MTANQKDILTKISKVFLIVILLIIFYLLALWLLKDKFIQHNISNKYRYNEYGDFIGGVLNPLFTLLSTSAIIFLTYIIAKNDSKKADESIATQKRITLNEMRHEVLNNMINKLNLFVYQLDKLTVQNVKVGSFQQKYLTHNLQTNEKERVIVWFVMFYELENFSKLSYLFEELFKDDEFLLTYNSLKETISTLTDEQTSIQMITATNLEKYIDLQQEFVSKIGNFILSKF